MNLAREGHKKHQSHCKGKRVKPWAVINGGRKQAGSAEQQQVPSSAQLCQPHAVSSRFSIEVDIAELILTRLGALSRTRYSRRGCQRITGELQLKRNALNRSWLPSCAVWGCCGNTESRAPAFRSKQESTRA